MAAINRAYFTPEECRAVLGKGSPDDDLVISRQAIAISRFFDRLTADFYGQDDEDVDRIYMPKGSGRQTIGWAESENPWRASGASRVLDIDPLVSLTAIRVDQGRDNTFSLTLAASDYELLPRNAALGPEAKPYRQVSLTPYGTQWSWLPGARVKLTGIFGWPSVPEAVWADCIELCGIWRGENPRATGNMNELETVVATSPMAMSLVKRIQQSYHRVTF